MNDKLNELERRQARLERWCATIEKMMKERGVDMELLKTKETE